MIVCHCYGVTDREIRACLQNGARTCADVANACGASSGCGGCASLVAEIVSGEQRHLPLLRGESPGQVRSGAVLPVNAAPAMAG